MASEKAQRPLISHPSQTETIEFEELDQSNNVIATYIKTSPAAPQDGYTREYLSGSSDDSPERIDVKVSSSWPIGQCIDTD